MKKFSITLFLFICSVLSNECKGQENSTYTKYSFKSGDVNGIGKWYMGREIAYGWKDPIEKKKKAFQI